MMYKIQNGQLILMCLSANLFIISANRRVRKINRLYIILTTTNSIALNYILIAMTLFDAFAVVS